jgi:hypothetical protein
VSFKLAVHRAPRARLYTRLKQPYRHVYTHRLHFGTRVPHCPEATHVCIVRAPVPPPHTHVPAPPHTLTSPTSPLSCLMHSASAVSSRKRQAWGIRQALCALVPQPTPNVSLSPDASMQTQAAGHREAAPLLSSVCRTMVHSARTPTTRPLPRPAAIASRHATSRAMQVTCAFLLSQAAPAALSSHHTAPVCLSFINASPHASPYTATSIGEGGGSKNRRSPSG